MSERKQFLNDFKYISENFPENISVYYVFEFSSCLGITYFELNRVSDELSLFFLKVFEKCPKYIGVYLSDYLFLPFVILGVWKSGSSFAGAGGQYTSNDTLKYLNFLNVKYVITDTNEKFNGEIISQFYIHRQKFFILSRWIADEGAELKNTDICYGIMTSGSTGEPKIIQVPWSCILPNAFELSDEFQIKQSDCIFQASPYTFDPFFIEFFLTLLNGCSLMITSNAIKISTSNLLQILFTCDTDSQQHKNLYFDSCNLVKEEQLFVVNINQTKKPKVSVLQMTPSIFKRWSDTEIKEFVLSSQTSLRILILGGEKFPNEILSLKSSSNKTRIFNIYGITEISCWSFLNEVTNLSHTEEVSLGKPLHHIKHRISDKGEFFIGSEVRICFVNTETVAQVDSLVFRNSGDLVKIADEKIYYLSRSNQVVKKYGMKIDLSKVEEAFINRNTSLKKCYCIFDENNMKVGLFYLPLEPEIREVNYFLISFEDFFKKGYRIPKEDIKDIEMPDYLIELTEPPLNAHGKCSGDKLLEHLTAVQEAVNPQLDVEGVFTKIWREVLRSEKTESLSNGFMELGGNSVMAVEIINKLEESGFRVPQNFISELLGEGNFETCLKCLKATTEDSATPRKKKKLDVDVPDGNDINLCVRWKFDLEKCVDATPTVFSYQGKERVVVGSHSSKLSCLDFDSGVEIWSVLLGDRIESGLRADEGGRRGFVGCYDGFVYCLDLSDGSLIWKFKTDDVVKSTPCLSTDETIVYVPSYDKHLYCLSTTDGRLVAKVRLSNGGIYSAGTVSHSLAAYYVGTLDGTCVAIDQETHRVRWRSLLKSPVFASPCLIGRKPEILFSEVMGVVYCFNAVDGTKKWTYRADGNIYSSPVVSESDNVNKIIFGCHDHHLYCLQYSEGPQVMWKRQLDSPVFGKPSIVFGHSRPQELVCAATTKGLLYLCHFTSGVVKSRVKLGGEVFSSAVVHENRIVLGCRDNNVYVLDICDAQSIP